MGCLLIDDDLPQCACMHPWQECQHIPEDKRLQPFNAYDLLPEVIEITLYDPKHDTITKFFRTKD